MRTVTVAKRMPQPGKKSGWSSVCQTGYRPRSWSAYNPIYMRMRSAVVLIPSSMLAYRQTCVYIQRKKPPSVSNQNFSGN